MKYIILLVGLLAIVGCKSQKKIAAEYEAFMADTKDVGESANTSKGQMKELDEQSKTMKGEDSDASLAWPTDEPQDMDEAKIVVKEEEATLLRGEDMAMDNFKYFVIIGSFANETNARNYKTTMKEKGFTPTILENKSGYFRVAVFQTQSEDDARQRIRTIRKSYPEHKDVWLLNRK